MHSDVNWCVCTILKLANMPADYLISVDRLIQFLNLAKASSTLLGYT